MCVETSAAVAKQHSNEMLLSEKEESLERLQAIARKDIKALRLQPYHPFTAIAEYALGLHVSSGLSWGLQWQCHSLQNSLLPPSDSFCWFLLQ